MRSEFPKDHPVARAIAQLDVHTIDVPALSPEETRQLAASLARGDAAIDADTIADEARGHPLFVAELVRHALLRDGRGPAPSHLEQAFSARVERVDDDRRELLELVAVAGAPVAREALLHASSLERDVLARRLEALVSAQLLRASGGRATDSVEPFHDRVRDSVLSRVPADRLRALHERLAVALTAGGNTDPEVLAVHWRGAGDEGRAALHMIEAADRAIEALAFDRAARLYRDALDLVGRGGEEPATLVVKLAEALAAAGRSAEAARAYLAAARSGAADDVELRLHAAEQLLRCGQFDEGMTALRGVLATLRIPLPSKRLSIASLLVRRAGLYVRGTRFRERRAAEVPPLDLMRIDACYSASAMLGMVDTIPAADFQARQLLYALRAGEPWRVSRALGTEASFACITGSPGRARAERLLADAGELAERLEDDRARGFALLNRGICGVLCGDWPAAREASEKCEAILRDRCAGVAWEVATAQFMGLNAMMQMGELSRVSARLPVILRGAHDRGDLYAVTQLRTWLSHMLHLAGDDPAGATHAVRSAMERWSRTGFHLQHWQSLNAHVNIAIYSGEFERAWKILDEQWPGLQASGLRRIQVIRVMAAFARGRAALASGRANIAREDARLLASERATWALPLSDVLMAGLAARAGDRGQAVARWRSAARGFDRSAMRLHAACARRRAEHDIATVDEWMHSQEIECPEKMAALLAPG
jgi:tetratricopeptide (TPR) repeat protein